MRTFNRSGLTALVLALAATACGGGAPAAMPTQDPGTVGPPAEGCGPVVNPPLQAGSHLIGDADPPTAYSSTPPTSGWHSSGALEVRIHDEADPLREPEQVSVLEADGVVITYRDVAPEDVQVLRELVASRYDGQVALTPYSQLQPGEVALTAWGALQRCAGVDADAIAAFIAAHVGDDVSPGHNH